MLGFWQRILLWGEGLSGLKRIKNKKWKTILRGMLAYLFLHHLFLILSLYLWSILLLDTFVLQILGVSIRICLHRVLTHIHNSLLLLHFPGYLVAKCLAIKLQWNFPIGHKTKPCKGCYILYYILCGWYMSMVSM